MKEDGLRFSGIVFQRYYFVSFLYNYFSKFDNLVVREFIDCYFYCSFLWSYWIKEFSSNVFCSESSVREFINLVLSSSLT